MKRILVLALVLLGFVLAGCEEERYGHHYRPYGVRPREGYRDGRYYGYEGRHYEGRGFRTLDETVESDVTPQTESTAQP